MKIKFIIIFLSILLCLPAYSMQESLVKNDTIIDNEIIELDEHDKTIPLEDLNVENNDFKSKISKYYTFDKGLLKFNGNEHFKFDYGAVGSVNWNINNDGYLHTNYQFNTTDLILSGNVNKNIDYKIQILPNRNINERTILGDLWVKGKHKNYSLQIGRMRKPFAYEPTFSIYYSDFASLSQISRLFSDHRDTGGKLLAEYKYADIALGLFSNMQNRPFSFHNKGIEFDTSLILKPLANHKDKGDLKIGGSIATGQKNLSYNNYGGFITYNHKKFGLKSEYIIKEASNYNEKKADGFYVDATYFLTDKLQAALRFDSYNPDNKHTNKRTNEYVAGLNYYLNNENIMLLLNYIYSHGFNNTQKIVLQMRYRTW